MNYRVKNNQFVVHLFQTIINTKVSNRGTIILGYPLGYLFKPLFPYFSSLSPIACLAFAK